MKAIPIQESIGMVLAHDVTRIVRGKCKGPAFKKGHVVCETDLPTLLDMGKAHLYVLDMPSGTVHENEAARRIAKAAAGPGLKLSSPSEGRVNMTACYSGLLKVDVAALYRLNALGDIVFATLHGNHRIEQDQPVAGARIVPLITDSTKIEAAERICAQNPPLISIKPFLSLNIGLITTGSEVYHGRIQDTFGPVVKRKFKELGSRVIDQILVSDQIDMTVAAINTLMDQGVDLIALTGGMSVDPDDQTPAGIRAAGAQVITYGAPTFPGAMFMLAYLKDVPIVGLPGCVMYYAASIFDLIVPRLLAGERLDKADIVKLGHGGFCAGCDTCRYPLCGFGKA